MPLPAAAALEDLAMPSVDRIYETVSKVGRRRGRRVSKLLLRGGCVLTLGVKTQNHAAADVLIDGEPIAEVGQGLRARDAEVVDATDTIVMPGFVDTHRHAWRALFRNMGASIPRSTPVSPASFGDRYTSDDVYAATLIGLLGAVEAGITTVVDWFDVPHRCRAAEAALRAHTDAGLRTVFVLCGPP